VKTLLECPYYVTGFWWVSFAMIKRANELGTFRVSEDSLKTECMSNIRAIRWTRPGGCRVVNMPRRYGMSSGYVHCDGVAFTTHSDGKCASH
jgi:hypothetical protein